MAQDIIPITLALTAGDLVTLWAPRWRQDGEEWEAFLGDDDALFAFADAADLAAWVATAEESGQEHDLADHPAWPVVVKLSVDELTPEDVQRYDVVGVPELVAGDPDTWTLDDLAEVAAMCRSLADVCDLEVVHEVLDATPAFAALTAGPTAFAGRDGQALWGELAEVVDERWDEVVDALDAMVTTPEVDEDLATRLRATATPRDTGDEAGDAEGEEAAPAENAENDPEDPEAVATDPKDVPDDAPSELREDTAGESLRSDLVDAAEEPEESFWEEVGIDPIAITTSEGEVITLRCYLDDAPVFLGRRGTIETFGSARALRTWIANEGAEGHDLADVATWEEVVGAATGGDLEIEVAPENRYVLAGVADDIAEGPDVVDAEQLELAVELVIDAADWADDTRTREALAPSESLGWLVSFVVRPDPTRLTPSPPFDREAAAWRGLEDRFLGRLRRH
ncbi:primosomal protein [Actinomycetospora rhizophila]|uniref:Primosomal protein n=1 Tax=Actinomycetospora rhizophila TaxID=1416876 RepID=A0ABV9ZIV5_9PSEU